MPSHQGNEQNPTSPPNDDNAAPQDYAAQLLDAIRQGAARGARPTEMRPGGAALASLGSKPAPDTKPAAPARETRGQGAGADASRKPAVRQAPTEGRPRATANRKAAAGTKPRNKETVPDGEAANRTTLAQVDRTPEDENHKPTGRRNRTTGGSENTERKSRAAIASGPEASERADGGGGAEPASEAAPAASRRTPQEKDDMPPT